MMMSQLTANDLKEYHCYSGKRKISVRLGNDVVYNDRMILDYNGITVKYDSPSVKPGQNYPQVSVEKFLQWADSDVTEQMPQGKWRDFLNGTSK